MMKTNSSIYIYIYKKKKRQVGGQGAPRDEEKTLFLSGPSFLFNLSEWPAFVLGLFGLYKSFVQYLNFNAHEYIMGPYARTLQLILSRSITTN
jgi:hypothetical protein